MVQACDNRGVRVHRMTCACREPRAWHSYLVTWCRTLPKMPRLLMWPAISVCMRVWKMSAHSTGASVHRRLELYVARKASRSVISCQRVGDTSSHVSVRKP